MYRYATVVINYASSVVIYDRNNVYTTGRTIFLQSKLRDPLSEKSSLKHWDLSHYDAPYLQENFKLFCEYALLTISE